MDEMERAEAKDTILRKCLELKEYVSLSIQMIKKELLPGLSDSEIFCLLEEIYDADVAVVNLETDGTYISKSVKTTGFLSAGGFTREVMDELKEKRSITELRDIKKRESKFNMTWGILITILVGIAIAIIKYFLK